MLWSTFLQGWAESVGHAQLQYVLTALTAFAVSLIAGGYLIRRFRDRRVFEDTSRPEHEGLNEIQTKKRDVPTMGGLMILAGMLAALVLWAELRSLYTVNGILCVAAFGALGLVDDYLKLTQPGRGGLKMRAKLVIQVLVGVLVAYILFVNISEVEGATRLYIPFCQGCSIEMGVAYLAWATLIIVATANAVNLADGLDGLAGGCAALAAAVMLGLGFIVARFGGDLEAFAGKTPGAGEMCVLASALLGGTLGFLWFNVHPALVFMGDTGALALGALLGYIALGLKLEIPLLFAGAVFFLDELTVFLQIGWFKLTRTRIFPIAPIHHHFQTGLKWPEQRITARLWVVAAVGAVVAFGLIRVGGVR